MGSGGFRASAGSIAFPPLLSTAWDPWRLEESTQSGMGCVRTSSSGFSRTIERTCGSGSRNQTPASPCGIAPRTPFARSRRRMGFPRRNRWRSRKIGRVRSGSGSNPGSPDSAGNNQLLPPGGRGAGRRGPGSASGPPRAALGRQRRGRRRPGGPPGRGEAGVRPVRPCAGPFERKRLLPHGGPMGTDLRRNDARPRPARPRQRPRSALLRGRRARTGCHRDVL